eukprot:gene5447-biopygen9626
MCREHKSHASSARIARLVSAHRAPPIARLRPKTASALSPAGAAVASSAAALSAPFRRAAGGAATRPPLRSWAAKEFESQAAKEIGAPQRGARVQPARPLVDDDDGGLVARRRRGGGEAERHLGAEPRRVAREGGGGEQLRRGGEPPGT